ncbi:MAG: hypothetical protein DWP98_09055 [Bacteroidetes bacterium]|nr:MAG: hypothetical protein DWP98_09055 [Bacteroidota bacterium]MBL1145695.1 hypothetical protein [Bacteroidota bacterium]NOG58489.1 histidine kinase [Bacteroidota bacterium]
MKRVLSLLLVLFCYSKVSAQFEYDIRYYGEESGFYDTDEISDIQVDSEGYVWIVSFSGITRYDGEVFEKFKSNNITHSNFLRFYEGADGIKVITDDEGRLFFVDSDSLIGHTLNDSLVKYNRFKLWIDIQVKSKNNITVSYRGFHTNCYLLLGTEIVKLNYPRYESFRGINVFINDKLNIYHTTDSSSFHLNGTFSLQDNNQKILDSIVFTDEQYLIQPEYIKLPNGEYLLIVGRNYLIHLNENKILSKLKIGRLSRIFLDSQGRLWLSTLDGEIYVNETNDYSSKENFIRLKIQNYSVSSEDKQGGIWMYSKNGKIQRLDIDLNIISKTKNANLTSFVGLNNNIVYYSTANRQLKWINLNTKDKDSLFIESMKDNELVSYLKISDSITWVTSRLQVVKLKDSMAEVIQFNELLYPNFRKNNSSVIKLGKNYDSDDLIIGSHNRFLFVVDKGFKFKKHIEFKSIITSVIKHSDFIYVGTKNGLFKGSLSDFIFKQVKKHRIQGTILNLLCFDKGIWFNANNKGVFYFKNEKLNELVVNECIITDPTIVLRDTNELWILSKSINIKLVKEDSLTMESFEPIKNYRVKGFVNDQKNLVFVTQKSGLVVLPFINLENKQLSYPDFFIENVSNGVSTIAPINSVYETKYSQRTINIMLRSISFINDKVSYRYKLSNIEEAWNVTNQRRIQYLQLPPGNYTFELQARTGSKPWSDSKIIHINVAKPYWQELWFLTAIAIILTLLIYWFVKSRIKASKRNDELIINNMKAEQRALRAQIDPHFIFNIISSAQYFIVSNNNIKANEFLNMFSSVLRSNLELAGMNTITLKQEIEFIDKYIKLEQFRLEGKFDYEIYSHKIANCLQEEIPQFMLQPFIENAIQHGLKDINGKGLLTIDFELEKEFFKVTIEDNGWGIKFIQKLKEKYNTKRETFGIEITKERLLLYNKNKKSIEIIDLVEEEKRGTRIVIYIKRILL